MTYAFRITHEPSGDEAEAQTKEAAIVAARSILDDNEYEGSCRIWLGDLVVDVVWANDETSYTHTSLGDPNA